MKVNLKLRLKNEVRWACFSLSFIGFFCLFGLNVYADMYFESKTVNDVPGLAGVEELARTWVTADKMKIAEDDGGIVIFRLDKGLMWDIDSSSKTYEEITFKEMKESVLQVKKDIESALAEMSPEERKQMEHFVPQFLTSEEAEVKLEKTGKKRDISNYRCELIIADSGTMRSEMWVTEQIKYDDAAKKFFEAISSIFSDIPSYQEIAFMYQSIIKIEGFPMETKTIVTMGNESYSSTSVVSKVEHKKINDSEFELPKGLIKVRVEEEP